MLLQFKSRKWLDTWVTPVFQKILIPGCSFDFLQNQHWLWGIINSKKSFLHPLHEKYIRYEIQCKLIIIRVEALKVGIPSSILDAYSRAPGSNPHVLEGCFWKCALKFELSYSWFKTSRFQLWIQSEIRQSLVFTSDDDSKWWSPWTATTNEFWWLLWQFCFACYGLLSRNACKCDYLKIYELIRSFLRLRFTSAAQSPLLQHIQAR